MSTSNAAIPISTPNNHQPSLDSNTNVEARKRMIAITNKTETNGTSQSDKARVVTGSHTIDRQRVINSPEWKKQYLLRRKKPSVKQLRSIWQIIGNLMVKGCVFAMLISWAGNAVWKLKEGKPLFGGPATPEERISEVEASLKKTTKMLQLQVDLVNKKFGDEIGSMHKDLLNQLQQTGNALEDQIKRLEGRTDRLDQIVHDFTESEFVSKKDFEKFVEGFRDYKGVPDSKELSLSKDSLDEMRLYAREIVEREIVRHAADGLGMVDYALWAGGARVVKHSEPFIAAKSSFFSKARSGGVHGNAQKVLEPSFGEPGQCFALAGSTGFVEIKLRASVVVHAVTLEHVAKSVAYDRTTAPRDCQVTGWYEGPDNDSSTGAQNMMHMLDFTYDLDKPNNAQTFTVDSSSDAAEQQQEVVNMVRLSFSSNHGNPSLTCLYRFRVHGSQPGNPTAITLQS